MAERKIKIVTDNGSDLPLSMAAQAGVDVIPFPIMSDGVTYLQGENFTTAEEFYQIMADAKDVPKHAQITPMRYFEEYLRLFHQGYTDVVVITITATASATFENAQTARRMFYEEFPQAQEAFQILIIDSRCYSVAYGYPVYEAGLMVQQGKTLGEITNYLDGWFSSMEIYVSAYSLEYARRSGRIGGAAAVVGGALGIKPIISIIDGEVRTYRKVRGNAAVAQALCEVALERMRPGSPYGMLYGTMEGVQETLRKEMVKAIGYEPFGIFKVGPAVALNIGPQMLGIGFLTDRAGGVIK